MFAKINDRTINTQAYPDSFAFSDFSSIQSLNLINNATQINNKIRLTAADTSQSGAIWYTNKQFIEQGFETIFQFQFTNQGPSVYGADGITFILQNLSDTAIGGGGGGIGYEGLPNSIAIEFDTYNNALDGDPNDNHISIHTNGQSPNSQLEVYSIGATTSIPNMKDGNVHTVKIQYSGNQIAVYLDDLNNSVLTTSLDIASTIALDSGRAYVGFTGATGANYENHDIISWVFRHNIPSTVLPPTITSFSPISGPIGTTVTINGTNFNTTPSNNIVRFGSVRANVLNVTASSLTVTVPAGATYTPITVTDTTTGLTAYSTKPFNVTFPSNHVVDSTSFASKVDFTPGNYPFKVAIGDLDGDGKPDLVATNINGNSVSIFRNTSTVGSISASSFENKIDFATGGSPQGLALADIDGDGKLDIIVSNYGSQTISVLRNTSVVGSFTINSFAPKVDFATGTDPYGVATGDLDGDGKPDIVVANGGNATVSVFHNESMKGSISLSSKVDFNTGFLPWAVAIQDIDGDGKPEMLVLNQNSSTFNIYQNTTVMGSITAGSFTPVGNVATGVTPKGLAIGDLNGDGKQDVVVCSGSGTLSVFRNISEPGTIPPSVFDVKVDFTSNVNQYSVGISDIDGDGKPDIVVGGWDGTNGRILIYNNKSTNSILDSSSFVPVSISNSSGLIASALGDLDGDGKPELAAITGQVSVFHNTIAPPPVVNFSIQPYAVYKDSTPNNLPKGSVWFVKEKFGSTWICGDSALIARADTSNLNHWTLMNNGIPSSVGINWLEFVNQSTMFAAGMDGTIYKTTDGGNSWNSVYSNLSLTNFINRITFIDANHGFAMGDGLSSSSIEAWLETTDGGATWVNNNSQLVAFGSFQAVRFVPPSNAYLAGWYLDPTKWGIWRSTDAGHNWSFSTVGTSSKDSATKTTSIDFKNSLEGIACRNDSTIWTTNDGGITWQQLGGKLPTRFFYASYVNGTNTVMLGGGGRASLAKVDLDAQTITLFQDSTQNVSFSYLDFPTLTHGYMSNGFNRAFYTTYPPQSKTIALIVDSTSAHYSDTVLVPFHINIPQGSSYSSAEISFSGFNNKLQFIGLDTSSTLIGTLGWMLQVNGNDSIVISASAGALDIQNSGILFRARFKVLTTNFGFIPVQIQHAIFNTGDDIVISSNGGVNVVPIPVYGDVDKNGLIQAADASKILKYLVGLDSLDLQSLANADATANGFISALDATAILKYVVHLINALPADSLTMGPLNAEGIFSLKSFTQGIVNSTIEIPINLSNGKNILSFEGKIKFNPNTLSWKQVTWSPLLSNFSIQVSVDTIHGEMRFAGAGPTPNGDETTFASLYFTVKNSDSSTVTLQELRLNEGKKLTNIGSSQIITTVARDQFSVPHEYSLSQNFPNPFNPSTVINYQLPLTNHVLIKIYDVLGREVQTLVNEDKAAGRYSVEFNASKLSSGVYFYSIRAGNYNAVRKMMLAK